jgi:hypothetical protein
VKTVETANPIFIADRNRDKLFLPDFRDIAPALFADLSTNWRRIVLGLCSRGQRQRRAQKITQEKSFVSKHLWLD